MEVDGAKVTGTFTSECNSEGVYGFNVMLPMTISIEENKIVEMAATISGRRSYRVSKGKQSVAVNGVTMTFSDARRPGPSNNTGENAGQFYEIILSTRE